MAAGPPAASFSEVLRGKRSLSLLRACPPFPPNWDASPFLSHLLWLKQFTLGKDCSSSCKRLNLDIGVGFASPETWDREGTGLGSTRGLQIRVTGYCCLEHSSVESTNQRHKTGLR